MRLRRFERIIYTVLTGAGVVWLWAVVEALRGHGRPLAGLALAFVAAAIALRLWAA